MEMLNGQDIGVLPFRGLKKISDLIFYDGPILSHFQDEFGENYFFYWIDYDNNFNRWLVFQISLPQLCQYLIKDVSLKDLFDSPLNNVFLSIEIGSELEYKNIKLIYKGELPEVYYPEQDSLFNFDIPTQYDEDVKRYQSERDLRLLTDAYLPDSIFLKAEPSNSINRKLVHVLDAAIFLNAIGNSFHGLLKYALTRDYKYTPKMLRKLSKTFKNYFEPAVVKASISSFGVGIGLPLIASRKTGHIPKEWKIKVIDEFRDNVINIDEKNNEETEALLNKYPIEARNEIYKPIIDLYNNKDIKIEVTDSNFVFKRQIQTIEPERVQKVLTKQEAPKPLQTVSKFARVPVNPTTNKIVNIKDATLFDIDIDAGWSKDEVILSDKIYKLKYKILAEYKEESGHHFLENADYGIFASGDSTDQAQTDFFEQFDYIYMRYNEIENSQLTDDVIHIRNNLNYIVKEIIYI